MREYALVLLVTAAVTYLLVPLVRRFAIASHAMQAPRQRDVHTEPTPRLGGLAMFGGLVAGLLVASRLTNLQDPFQSAGSRTQSGLLLAGGLIVIIGFIDDRWGMNAVSKLAGQVAAAGILVWSGQALPWFPEPNGHELSLEPDLSVTLTILIVVVTINAINFIDGMDGLAAGIVAVTAIGFLVYSYSLVTTLNSPSLSLPAVSSALLAGMCIGFLPHNFYPARIFMGDTGAMLLGLLLAYGPLSSTGSLDPAVLVNYATNHPYNRFGTFLPLLVPAAIFLIPYTDLMLAVIRRTRRGIPLMAADREHLHHRLMNIGHSYRQSVLIMWLWAAMLSATVVALSLVRTHLWVLAVATFAAVLALLPVTMPNLRPWRLFVREAPGPALSPAATTSSPVPAPAGAAGAASSAASAFSAEPAVPAVPSIPGAESAGAPGWRIEADRARIAPASAFAAAPVARRGAMPASPPDGFGDGPVNGFGDAQVNGFGGSPVGGFGGSPVGGHEGEPGGPPPGFEPVPAPPGFAGDGSTAGLWAETYGNGAGEHPFRRFPEQTESGLRSFPGDTEEAAQFTDPFPRAGRLPDAPKFPDIPELPDPPQPSDGPSAVPGSAAFTDEASTLDDTDQFPTASHPDPRLDLSVSAACAPRSDHAEPRSVRTICLAVSSDRIIVRMAVRGSGSGAYFADGHGDLCTIAPGWPGSGW